MKYTGSNMTEVLEAHKRWLKKNGGIMDKNRADFYGCDLQYADLRDENLSQAYMNHANLAYANLNGANLHGTKLEYADLRGADLRGCDLRYCNLSQACLRGADLLYADLDGVDLRGADLFGANLISAKNVPYIPLACPETGAFIGWKKARGICNVVVKLQITEDAKRSSATTDKCRCNKAIVLAVENLNGTPYGGKIARSMYDPYFFYEVGKTVKVADFDDNRWNECSTGIHFFVNRESAVRY